MNLVTAFGKYPIDQSITNYGFSNAFWRRFQLTNLVTHFQLTHLLSLYFWFYTFQWRTLAEILIIDLATPFDKDSN